MISPNGAWDVVTYEASTNAQRKSSCLRRRGELRCDDDVVDAQKMRRNEVRHLGQAYLPLGRYSNVVPVCHLIWTDVFIEILPVRDDIIAEISRLRRVALLGPNNLAPPFKRAADLHYIHVPNPTMERSFTLIVAMDEAVVVSDSITVSRGTTPRIDATLRVRPGAGSW